MEPWTLGLVIVIIGIIFLLAELITVGTTFLVFPGSILVLMGMVLMAAPELITGENWVLTAVGIIGASTALTIIVIMFYKRLGKTHPPMTSSIDSLIGRRGVVIRKVEPHTLKGKVKIGSTIWSATSDGVIEENEVVEVIDAEGVHITVERISEEEETENVEKESEG